jgi:hypothetical protein
LILLLLVAGVGLLFRAASRPEQIVVPKRELPALHIIDSADVTVRRELSSFGMTGTVKEVQGRLVLRSLPGGRAIPKDQLSSVTFEDPSSLASRRLISIPVPGHGLALAREGGRVDLILSPREQRNGAEPHATVYDAIVLRTQGGGDTASVVVAVDSASVSLLARLLGSSDVFIVERPVIPPTPGGRLKKPAEARDGRSPRNP